MGSKKVDLARLAVAIGDFSFAYLITVSDDYRVHTVTVNPVMREGILVVGPIGGRTRSNLTDRSDGTLLWPPREPGGYSLIVDGHATVTHTGTETSELTIAPVRALLHRNAESQGQLHDCVVLSEV
jgi:hypothetical protein